MSVVWPRKRIKTRSNREDWSYGLVKLRQTHYRLEVFSFFLNNLSHINELVLNTKFFLSSPAAASVCARGSYIEVKTDMRKMLYEALRSVLPNSSEAPVILIISKWCITMNTTSMIILKNKNTEK